MDVKILNYGSLNFDYTYQVSHMVTPGETLISPSLAVHCGGKGLNQSVALARAGVKVFHAGMVGEDGGRLLDVCSREGIDTSSVRVCPGKTGHTIIQVDKEGENCILLYCGANHQNTEEQIERVLAQFSAGDVLLLQNEVNLVGLLIEKAAEKGMRIVLNPSPFEEKLLSYRLERVHTFLINETEGVEMSGETAPEAILDSLLKKYPDSEFVLTLGKEGAWLASSLERIKMPAFVVRTVDTTAAGDTFTGYYLAGMMGGATRRECLRRACGAAALATTREGAVDSIPGAEEVETFLLSAGKER